MWKTIVPAAAVLAAEAVIRRKINALPAETFPLRLEDNPSYVAYQGEGDVTEYREGVFVGYLRPPQRSRRWRPCAPAAGAARRCRSAWA